jgi:hypothetical protein
MRMLRRLKAIAIADGLRARTHERMAETAAQRKRYYEAAIKKSVEPRMVLSEMRRLRYRVPAELRELADLVIEERESDPQPDSPADAPEYITQLAAKLDDTTLHRWRWSATTEEIKQVIEEYVKERGWTSRREIPAPSGVVQYDNQRIRCAEATRADLGVYRGDGRRIIIEIDRTDKALSLCKLQCAVDRGDEAVWVRWGMPAQKDVPTGVHVIRLPYSHAAFWRRGRRSAQRESGAGPARTIRIKRSVTRMTDAQSSAHSTARSLA